MINKKNYELIRGSYLKKILYIISWWRCWNMLAHGLYINRQLYICIYWCRLWNFSSLLFFYKGNSTKKTSLGWNRSNLKNQRFKNVKSTSRFGGGRGKSVFVPFPTFFNVSFSLIFARSSSNSMHASEVVSISRFRSDYANNFN